MKYFYTLLLLCIFSNFSYAFTEINTSTVQEDYKNGNMEKYKYDNLSFFNTSALISQKIITKEEELDRFVPESMSIYDIKTHVTCSFVGDQYTATIYSIDLANGNVTCMISKKGDLYNPLGLFNTHYPNMKKAYELDLKKAEQAKQSEIAAADLQFSPLKKIKDNINTSTTTNQTGQYLTIPELLTAAILTDTDIIDVQATQSSDKLQLKNSFVSKYYDANSREFIDNKEYLLADAETIFNVYTGLSDVSMIYFVILIAFFAVWGIGHKVLSHFTSKVEEKQNHEKVTPYIGGIIAGILFFFPTGFKEQITNQNGSVVAEYNMMKTEYQEWEKAGYYLFTDWADAAAKVIIDAEMDAIVEKSGVTTKDQIIQNQALITQYLSLANTNNKLWHLCRNEMYNYSGLFNSDGKHQYSKDPNQPFPLNEKWAYVNSKLGSNTSSLYYSVKDGEVKGDSAYSANVLQKINSTNPLDNYYPEMALSACGNVYYEHQKNSNKLKDLISKQDQLTGTGLNSANKIPQLEGLVKFQYELYRDWGYLAVLGLPVTKLQTEYIGGLYETRRSEVLDKLNDQVKEDSMGAHMIMSSIPYLFIPGAGTVFQVISENAGKLGAALGTSTGPIGTIVGAVVGTAGGGAFGMWAAYNVSKTLLELTPIIGIVIIGLLRFVIIMVKIFSFHFASLFMMPIMFARENIQAISRFSMKIFATMLELPIFVLSVWLAITASSLIHTIGDVFGKKIIIAMLENNSTQYQNVAGVLGINGEWLSKLKIYVFDGFIEIAIAVFSVIIIYKIIVSLHSTLFEIIEVQGSKELDNAIESMKNESQGWGNRM